MEEKTRLTQEPKRPCDQPRPWLRWCPHCRKFVMVLPDDPRRRCSNCRS